MYKYVLFFLIGLGVSGCSTSTTGTNGADPTNGQSGSLPTPDQFGSYAQYRKEIENFNATQQSSQADVSPIESAESLGELPEELSGESPRKSLTESPEETSGETPVESLREPSGTSSGASSVTPVQNPPETAAQTTTTTTGPSAAVQQTTSSTAPATAPVIEQLTTHQPDLSDENDFERISQNRSIEDDAEKITQNRQKYRIIAPKELPQRPKNAPANIVAYALQTQNMVGEKLYTRRGFNLAARSLRNCIVYASDDRAQQAFMENGGPQKDPLNLDPDGDGYACGWDPASFRSAISK